MRQLSSYHRHQDPYVATGSDSDWGDAELHQADFLTLAINRCKPYNSIVGYACRVSQWDLEVVVHQQLLQVPQPPVHHVGNDETTTTTSKKSYSDATRDDEFSQQTHAESNDSNVSFHKQRVSPEYHKPNFNKTPTKTSYPITTVGADRYPNAELHIKAYTLARNIIKAKQEDEYEDDIDFNIVANTFIQACNSIDPRYNVILKNVIELSPTKASNPNDVKVQANIVVTLKSEDYHLASKTAEISKLREIIQQVISTDCHHAVENIPNYIKAFQFDIQQVLNHPEYTAFALILGIPPNITNRRDTMGNDKLCEEIVNTLPLNASNNLPHALNSTVNRWKNIGIIHYASSKVKVDGRYGKIYGLVYSKTEGGLEAAEAIMNAYP
eukprot:scaffold9391_cov39-Cyclotella_meneghiniana.AAC.5